MCTGKTDIFFIKFDVFQNAFHVIAVDALVSVHVHIGDGGRAFLDFQMGDVESFLFQGFDHPFAVFIRAGGGDDGDIDAKLLEIDTGVDDVAGRILFS